MKIMLTCDGPIIFQGGVTRAHEAVLNGHLPCLEYLWERVPETLRAVDEVCKNI
jgi:hypothetical protein